MKTKIVASVVTFWILCTGVGAAAPDQDLNKGMPLLADKLTKSMAAQGVKKIAAMDFTNPQNLPTELGRLLVDRLTVEITSVAEGRIRMLDRENTKRILDELKLTQSGLVDPANAKRLGEFAGADALLVGTVSVSEDGCVLTVKVISAGSSEIVAAGRIEFPKTAAVIEQQNRLIAQGGGFSASASAGSPAYKADGVIASKELGPLRVDLKSVTPIRVPGRDNRGDSGMRVSFDLVSRESQRSVAVAINAEPPNMNRRSDPVIARAQLLDDEGGVWALATSAVSGLGSVRAGVHGRDGMQAYGAGDIVRLLTLRDRLGRDVDDPADGTTDGAGFVNAYGAPPRSFFPYSGNRFVSGLATAVRPGQVLAVTMDFVATTNGAPPRFVQLTTEFVVGLIESNGRASYSLLNLAFDKVAFGGGPQFPATRPVGPR